MKVAICDDEVVCIKQMERLLKDIPEVKSIDSFDDIDRLNLSLEKDSYDLIFMDIEWKGHEKKGTRYAAEINENFPGIQFVFFTAYNDRFSESIFFEKVNLCGYLVKPIKFDNLKFLVEKALKNIKKQQEENIVVQYRGITETLHFSDIMYMESNAHQLSIYMINRQIQVYKKLDDFEKVMENSFVRNHKSFMVNMNYIKRLERSSLTLKDGTVLPISKTKYQMTKDKFFKFMREQL